MKKLNQKPTFGEMEILEAIWNLGPSTVRTIHDYLELNPERKKKSYTTTLKFMQNMLEKGFLSRDESTKKHLYHAKISQKESVQNNLDQIVEKAFQGSSMKLVMQLLGNKKTSKKDIEEIRSFLDQIDKTTK